MKTFISLLGNIRDSDTGLIIQIIGEEISLPRSEYNDISDWGPTNAIEVKSYKILSKIPYHEFLVEEAGKYTQEKYSCLVSIPNIGYKSIGTKWNKEFGWEINDGKAILKVRMTNTDSDEEPQPFYELWYDGNSGQFIKEIKQPTGKNFCEN